MRRGKLLVADGVCSATTLIILVVLDLFMLHCIVLVLHCIDYLRCAKMQKDVSIR